MKLLIKTLAIIGISILLGLAGCKGLINHIYNRTDCEQFNIDNIEVRTGINIPAVSDVTCEFKESENTKVSVFVLKKHGLDFEEYITKNSFVKEGDFYVNTDERDDTKWTATLNETTLELKVELVYK